MTEQELIQENEKLKARLAKAVEVFKEQKENIVTLTAERDKAFEDIRLQTEKVQKLEAKLTEKASNDDKFFEQEEEIGNLRANLEKHEMECNALTEANEGFKKNLELKNKELNELRIADEEQIKTWKNKAEEVTVNYNKLQEQMTAFNASIEEHKQKIVQLQEINSKLQAERTALVQSKSELEDRITSLTNELAKTRKDFEAQVNTLRMELSKSNSNYEKTKTSIENAKQTVTKMQELNNSLINNFNIFG